LITVVEVKHSPPAAGRRRQAKHPFAATVTVASPWFSIIIDKPVKPSGTPVATPP
jgi:hypothetical protein